MSPLGPCAVKRLTAPSRDWCETTMASARSDTAMPKGSAGSVSPRILSLGSTPARCPSPHRPLRGLTAVETRKSGPRWGADSGGAIVVDVEERERRFAANRHEERELPAGIGRCSRAGTPGPALGAPSAGWQTNNKSVAKARFWRESRTSERTADRRGALGSNGPARARAEASALLLAPSRCKGPRKVPPTRATRGASSTRGCAGDRRLEQRPR